MFRFYSGLHLGIKKAGRNIKGGKKIHERGAGETLRGNEEAGADPFLQASDVAADVTQNGYPHANLETDTPSDGSRRRHAETCM